MPNASDWGSIQFPDASPDNSNLTYCDIRYGGSGAVGVLQFISSSHTVANCVIRRSYFGVDCQGSAAPNINGTSIEASTVTPIVLDFTAAPVLSSLVFSSSNNGYDAFGLRGNTLVSGTFATLPQRGATVGVNPISNVTYVLLGTLTINTGAGLTINPGVVIKPTSGFSIVVNGNLTMNGTAGAGNQIVITSIHDDNFGLPSDTNNNGSITAPNRGDWSRITFNQGSTGSVQYCTLKFGTNSLGNGVVEMFNNSIGVANCTLSDAAHGLALFGVSNPTINLVAINNCSSTPILMSVSANPVFTNITFLANAFTALGLEGEQINVDSHLLQERRGLHEHHVLPDERHAGDAEPLDPDDRPGRRDQEPALGGRLHHRRWADRRWHTSAQIVLTTLERDDNYGNPPDTNGDGSTTTPAQSNWSNIHFTGTVERRDQQAGQLPAHVQLGWAVRRLVHEPLDHERGTDDHGVHDHEGPVRHPRGWQRHADDRRLRHQQLLVGADRDVGLSDPAIGATNTYSTNGYSAIGLLVRDAVAERTDQVPPAGGVTDVRLPADRDDHGGERRHALDRSAGCDQTELVVHRIHRERGAERGRQTATGRVIFTSRRGDNPAYGATPRRPMRLSPQAGDWGNIVFNDTAVDAQCILRNILFQFGGSGGSDGGTITTASASPRLVRLEFFQNITAMSFAGVSTPTVDTTNVFNCTGLPIVYSLLSVRSSRSRSDRAREQRIHLPRHPGRDDRLRCAHARAPHQRDRQYRLLPVHHDHDRVRRQVDGRSRCGDQVWTGL